jgi:phage FluMu gp28-like protein
MIWKAQTVKEYVEETGDKPIYFGIDFGKSIGETVVIIVEEYEKEKFRVIWIEPMLGIDYPVQMETIRQLSVVYNPICINVDATGPGGQTMYDFLVADDDLSSKVWGCKFDSSFKEKIIIRTRMLMSRGRLLLPTKELPWAEVLEQQLHQVQRTITESGERTRYSGKQEGKNDDYAWALALSVYKEFSLEDDNSFFQTVTDEGFDNLNKIFKR